MRFEVSTQYYWRIIEIMYEFILNMIPFKYIIPSNKIIDDIVYVGIYVDERIVAPFFQTFQVLIKNFSRQEIPISIKVEIELETIGILNSWELHELIPLENPKILLSESLSGILSENNTGVNYSDPKNRIDLDIIIKLDYEIEYKVKSWFSREKKKKIKRSDEWKAERSGNQWNYKKKT